MQVKLKIKNLDFDVKEKSAKKWNILYWMHFLMNLIRKKRVPFVHEIQFIRGWCGKGAPGGGREDYCRKQ